MTHQTICIEAFIPVVSAGNVTCRFHRSFCFGGFTCFQFSPRFSNYLVDCTGLNRAGCYRNSI